MDVVKHMYLFKWRGDRDFTFLMSNWEMLSFIAQKRHMLFVQLPNWTSLGTIHVINSNFFWLTVFSIYVRFRLNSELIQCVYWMNICSFGSTSNGRQVAIQSEYKRNAEASGYHPTYGLLWFLNERAENVDEEERRLHLEPLGSNGKMLS